MNFSVVTAIKYNSENFYELKVIQITQKFRYPPTPLQQ